MPTEKCYRLLNDKGIKKVLIGFIFLLCVVVIATAALVNYFAISNVAQVILTGISGFSCFMALIVVNEKTDMFLSQTYKDNKKKYLTLKNQLKKKIN
ncbi:MAG: hypothetical protein FWH37_09035 [Candidatus Bathyarchaeota archaeon]|nr:hypothetical protein [Candidatus Termiticorpusculum sp.]